MILGYQHIKAKMKLLEGITNNPARIMMKDESLIFARSMYCIHVLLS